MSRAIKLIREVKRGTIGSWESVLPQCGVTAPKKGHHGPCPICGGNDRFHFIDDHGGGEWHCRQCDEPNHGDGLDLISRAHGITITVAAQKVASVLGIDYPTAEAAPEAASHRKSQLAIENQRREQERQREAWHETARRWNTFNASYRALTEAVATEQPSAYLASKGLAHPLPVLPDRFTLPKQPGRKTLSFPAGTLLLPLVDESGAVTAAQTITPKGGKILVPGSAKKGAFYAVNIQEQPEAVLIAEGLATVLSVYQMRPDALAVAAVDAGNLLPVAEVMRRRYPEAQIIIAADNDIKPGEPNTGKEAAEKAAKAVSGWVALPHSDEKADWNDVHQRNGLEATAAAFNDSMYQPGSEAVKSKHGAAVAAEVININKGKKHQNRQSDDLKPFVELRHGALHFIKPEINKQTGEIEEIATWIADDMETVGIGNDGGMAYLIIRMCPEGTSKTIYEALPRSELGLPVGWSRLRGRGVAIDTQGSSLNQLAKYLQREGKRTMWEVTSTAGWHCGAYVMPDGEVIGEPDMPVAFCGGTSAIKGYVVRGTAAEWRDNVASLMRGNHSMMLGVLVGLTAPLNSLVGGRCFGIHLFAQSSVGKTTTVEAATSLYGDPEMLKLSWDATRHGLTVEAAARNDGFIPIDEIGQGGKVTEIAQSAYSLFNGVGRIQGKKEGGNRPVTRWKIAALSTGEEDFETFLMKGGITPKAGQLVRLLSVPFIDTVDFNGYDDGDAHSRAVKRLSGRYCGASGRAWIRWLTENKDQAIELSAQKETEWLSRLPEGASSQVSRVASRFAMLDAAGELAGNITGWTARECQEATQRAFNDWLEDFGLDSREKYQVITRARDFIQRHALSRFQPYAFGKSNGDMDQHHATRITNLAGYLVNGRRDDGRPEYHIIPSVFDEEILCGISRHFGCKALEDAGMLVCAESGRWTTKTVKVNGTQQRFIVLTDQPEE
ncbi:MULTISPECIES: DUF927 domain-containing protein [Klebsiella/Raoultella group]|uniref:DUF927 domain-containing protein n=1 Tax=Klebsiella/Raoultella group TaxID=2890311 RepID=UPI001D0FE512|nr:MULTISPECIES: DUF927 domain-containing protein [Klebsiella/Raoultella group]MDC7944411.1 DUF927 domain-containing protein [Raoultella ornithinolytica]